MAQIIARNLSEYFDAFGPALVLYARQWVSDDQAGDLVQSAFLSLLAGRSDISNVKAWLFRAVRNGAMTRLRSERRRQTHERERVSRDGERFFEARPDDLIDAATAQAALMALPDNQREIIVLRIWAGLTVQEIAHTTGLPTTTVFRRYRSALAAIRKEMHSCRNLKT